MEAMTLKIRNILLFVLLIGHLSSVLAATALGDYTNENHPGKCYVNAKEIYPPGVHDYPPCAQLDCSSNGWGQVNMCSAEVADDGCYDDGYVDRTRKYPICCQKKFICDDDY